MTANADNIWKVPAYWPYLQPPLTDEALMAAEDHIGYRLPAALIELLRRQNGGYIRYCLPGKVHHVIAGIGPHFPSLTNFDWTEVQDDVSFPLQGLIPFDGDGHWHLCLDYRDHPATPPVTYIDVECDEQTRIADSFSHYLGQLHLDTGNALATEPIADSATLITALSEALGVKFDAPDTWAEGYPTLRAALGTQANPQWLWISPNRVVRGFVRPDDPRYAALKDSMPGHALRFPSLSPASLIVDTTDDARQRVIAAFRHCGIGIRELEAFLNDC